MGCNYRFEYDCCWVYSTKMVELDAKNRIHRITAPIRSVNEIKKQLADYHDPQKVMGYSKKKRKIVMKYPRKTFWRKYWQNRNKKKLNKTKSVKKHG